MQDRKEMIEQARFLLEKNIQERDLEDLNQLLIIKHRISYMIPYAKKDLRIKELEADTIEKETILRLRGEKNKGSKETLDEIKAKARLNRNSKEKDVIELENKYITLYGFYQELADSIITTRLVMKM